MRRHCGRPHSSHCQSLPPARIRNRRAHHSIYSFFWFLWVTAAACAFTRPPPPPFRPRVTPVATATALHVSAVAADAHRNIIVLSHNVSDDVALGFFDVNNLLTGRIDVLARCINSALWVSHGIRRDTSVFLMLFPHNITVEITGRSVVDLNPDERTTALCLQRTLLGGSSGSGDEADLLNRLRQKDPQQPKRPAIVNPDKPGSLPKSERLALRTARKHREAMIRRIHRSRHRSTSDGGSNDVPLGFTLHRNDTLKARLEKIASAAAGDLQGPIMMLDEDGEMLQDALANIKENSDRPETGDLPAATTLILGDQAGYAPGDEELLLAPGREHAVTQVSLGPLSLLTSQCITIAHHYLDVHALLRRQEQVND